MGYINFSKDNISGEITFETDVFDEVSTFTVNGSWNKSQLVAEINSLVSDLPAHSGLASCSADQSSPEDIYSVLNVMGFNLYLPFEWEEYLAEIAQEEEQAEHFGVCF
ncbi:hypothetical protein [Xenorhabdus eapokensis]|uniref:Uncharacterized protein n=1 Tax=Xenorhabdus eapokensis TaxID=1873482 RepID=A0A1Q5TN38_9GAMM|nr:hypothetical protein [Xenorhabdus eapokensis]OKP01612.1 hypothetical protein Xedl_02888 [Xenorhabdus eapokensis]